MPYEITEEDLRWVRGLARRMKGRLGPFSDVDDIEGDGLVALIGVARRWDESVGVRSFRVYARPRVVGAMIDGYRTWHGTNRKCQARLTSLDRAMELNERHADSPWWRVSEPSVVDDHDVFEFREAFAGRLSEDDWTLVSLLVLDDMKKQDVARMFYVDPSAVSHRLRKIRASLAEAGNRPPQSH